MKLRSHRKALARLKVRQETFDGMREKQGFKRPGSMNPHKQRANGLGTGRRR